MCTGLASIVGRTSPVESLALHGKSTIANFEMPRACCLAWLQSHAKVCTSFFCNALLACAYLAAHQGIDQGGLASNRHTHDCHLQKLLLGWWDCRLSSSLQGACPGQAVGQEGLWRASKLGVLMVGVVYLCNWKVWYRLHKATGNLNVACKVHELQKGGCLQACAGKPNLLHLTPALCTC